MGEVTIRRRLNEEYSKTTYGFYAVFAIVTYFIWCDLSFFGELAAEQERKLNGNNISTTKPQKSIKLRTQDHFGHYVDIPVATWIDKTFHISQIPFVTPNFITGIHFTLAMLCGRLVASQKLRTRRMGVILYFVRTMLDALDGVVYRAQSSTKEFNTGWGTYGYLIDATADTLGGIFLLIGTLYRWIKNPPIQNPEVISRKKSKQDLESKEKLLSDDSCSEKNDEYYGIKRYSKASIYFTGVVFATIVFVRSSLWDHFTYNYYNLLSAKRSDIPQVKQNEVLGYRSTWFSLWLWTINSADAFMNFTLFAIFFDKLWRWMRFNIYSSLPNLLVVFAFCQIHLNQMRHLLGVNS